MKLVYRFSAIACATLAALAVGCSGAADSDDDQSQDAIRGSEVAAQQKYKILQLSKPAVAAKSFGVARWEVYSRGNGGDIESTLFVALDGSGEAKYSIEVARELRAGRSAGLALEWIGDKATPLKTTNASLGQALNADIKALADELGRTTNRLSDYTTSCKLKIAGVAAATLVLAVAGGAEVAGALVLGEGLTTLATWLGLTTIGQFVVGAAELRAAVYLFNKQFSCE